MAQLLDLSSYQTLKNLNEEQLDELPYGAIRLDKTGKIISYNRFESLLAGIAKENAIGKNFFTEIAPCTDVREFRGRFEEGVAKKKLHEKFRYHFPFRHQPRNVMITLFFHAETDDAWVFVQPIE